MTKNKKLFVRIISTFIVASVLLAFATACGDDGEIDRKEATEIVEGAMAKLETNAYTVTVTSYVSSTDSEIATAIGENRSSVIITLDGDSYAFTEKRGTESIRYLFVDDVLYVNESFIGIITKQSYAVNKTADMTDDEYREKLAEMQKEKNENYENFVGKYLEDVTLKLGSRREKKKYGIRVLGFPCLFLRYRCGKRGGKPVRRLERYRRSFCQR